MPLRTRTPRRWIERLAAGLVLSLCACATLPGAAVPDRIYEVSTGRVIDRATLTARLAAVRYRLLGEVHDDPLQHRLRADLLRALASRGARPAVVFEQFDLPHEAALSAAQAAGADADALATAGQLDRRGWKWPLHEPLLTAALALRLPVHAGNVPSVALRPELEGNGRAAVTADVRDAVARAPWSEAQESALAGEIRDAHCGRLPDALVPRFARAQRLRDAAMALALMRHATADGTVLIAGNGHVRRDRGVPLYLPAGSSSSVGFVEVAPGEAPLDVVREARGAYDYVWLTPEVARPDPCATLAPMG